MKALLKVRVRVQYCNLMECITKFSNYLKVVFMLLLCHKDSSDICTPGRWKKNHKANMHFFSCTVALHSDAFISYAGGGKLWSSTEAQLFGSRNIDSTFIFIPEKGQKCDGNGQTVARTETITISSNKSKDFFNLYFCCHTFMFICKY